MADGTLVDDGHPASIFNKEVFRILKRNRALPAEHYGISMEIEPGCEKGAEYALKKLERIYLPCAVRYFGDPFAGISVFCDYTIQVTRNDGRDGSFYFGPSYRPGVGSWGIGLAKGADKYEMDLDYLAASVLTVCEDANWCSFVFYVNRFVMGDLEGIDPVPQIRMDIRRGRSNAEEDSWYRDITPMWAVFEELREKHPTFILDYCNLKNRRYVEGKLPPKLSLEQMAGLLGEVTGENVSALFAKYDIRER